MPTLTADDFKYAEYELEEKWRLEEICSRGDLFVHPLDDYLLRFEVLSNGTAYVVKLTESYEHGDVCTWECNCPAGKHGRDCKHLSAVLGWLDDWRNDHPQYD